MADDSRKQQVKNFLQLYRTASLATVSEKNEPEVAMVNYVLDDNFNLYFVARAQSRKAHNLEHNMRVGFYVGGDPHIPVIVQMQGSAEKVTDQHTMIDYLSKQTDLGDKNWEPLFKTPGVDFVLYKVKIDWLRWLNMNVANYPETYMKDFEQILP